jgi:hypothetical protein
MRPLLRAAALCGAAAAAAAAPSLPVIPPALHYALPCGVQGRSAYVQGEVVAPTGPGYLLGWSGESDRLICWDTNATDAGGHCDDGDLLLNARPLTRFPPGGVLFLEGLCCTLPRCPAGVSIPDPALADAVDDPDNVAIVYYTYDESARLDALLGGAAGAAADGGVAPAAGGAVAAAGHDAEGGVDSANHDDGEDEEEAGGDALPQGHARAHPADEEGEALELE